MNNSSDSLQLSQVCSQNITPTLNRPNVNVGKANTVKANPNTSHIAQLSNNYNSHDHSLHPHYQGFPPPVQHTLINKMQYKSNEVDKTPTPGGNPWVYPRPQPLEKNPLQKDNSNPFAFQSYMRFM